MAIREGGKDAAYLQSARNWHKPNDQYSGRLRDEDLAESDGKCLGERDEWNLAKVARRAKWEAGPED
jgi:hypothetical protein